MSLSATSAVAIATRNRLPRDRAYIRFVMLTALVLALGAFFSIRAPSFLTAGNLVEISRDMAILVPVAIGFAFVLIAGEIDLSVGAAAALNAVMVAYLMAHGFPVALAVVLAVATGAVIGTVNGLVTLRLGVPSFITTLGMLSITSGLALALSQQPIVIQNSAFTKVINGEVVGVPLSIIYVVLFAILAFALLRSTLLGVRVRAVGSDETAARRLGVNTGRWKQGVFVLSGVCAGVSGVLLAARLGYGAADASPDLLLNSAAAVMLGGSRLGGGKGSIAGTVLAALVLVIALNGIAVMGLSQTYEQTLMRGGILALVVLSMRP